MKSRILSLLFFGCVVLLLPSLLLSHPAAAASSCPFPHPAKRISCDHDNAAKLRVEDRCFLPCERETSKSCVHAGILTCELPPDQDGAGVAAACSCPGCKDAVVVSPGARHTEELQCAPGQRIILQSLYMYAKSSNPVSDPDVEVHVEPRTGPPLPEWRSHYTDCWQRDPKEPYVHEDEYLRAMFTCRNSFFDCKISQIVHFQCEDLPPTPAPTPAPTPDTPTPTPDTPTPTETEDPSGGDGGKGSGDSDSSLALAIGIGIGAGLIGIGLIALSVYFLCFRKQQQAGAVLGTGGGLGGGGGGGLYSAHEPLIQN